MAVIYPVRPGDAPPDITRIDDLTVEVRSGPERDVISFRRDAAASATLVVDTPSLTPLPAPH
jgi:hypothetical protein